MRHVISYFMGVVDPCDDPPRTQHKPKLVPAVTAAVTSGGGPATASSHDNNACWIVDVDSVTALAQTCRTWNQAVSDPQLWTVHSSQSFQSPPRHEALASPTRMIPGHCFFHQPLLHNNNRMKKNNNNNKGQGHSSPPPPLVGFVRVVTPIPKQEKSSHSGSPEDHQQPVVDATSTTTTSTSTTDPWWWMVREHASQEPFFVSQCLNPSLPTCLQESFVFGYCYSWQCRTRRELYTLYKQQQQQPQQQLKQQSSSRRLLLRVPYVCQSVPNPHADPQHSDHSNSTRSWLRRVYFPESHALTPAMVDTHVGRSHLFQSHVIGNQPPENDATTTATTPHHAPLQDEIVRPTENHNNNSHTNKVEKEEEDNLGLVVGLWHHYQRLEHAAYPTTASTTIPTSTTTRTAWFQLLDWVCELVHVLEVPHSVAFRTAVCLAPLVQDYGQQQQQQQSQPPHAEQPRPRRLPPLQLVTAAVVYMASCLSVGGPSDDHNHHNHNQSSLEPPFSSHRLLSLEHLAFCVDNQWPARTIQAVARLLWLRGAASSPLPPPHDDGDDWSHSNHPKTTTPLLGPAQLATPTVEQWLHVYLETLSTTTTTRTTNAIRLDPATVRALALDVAWFLLPSSLSLELRPRHLAACIVVMARWARQLVPQQPPPEEATPNDNNDQDRTASLPSLVQPPVDLNWTWATACNLWCAVEPRSSVTCTTTSTTTSSTSTSVFWDHEVVPLLPRVLETLHRLYPEQWWATNHHATTTASRVVWGHRRRRRRPCPTQPQHSHQEAMPQGLDAQQPQEQEQQEGMEAAASLYRLWSQSR